MARQNLIRKHQYELERFNFPAILKALLEVEDLTRLYSGLDPKKTSDSHSIYKNMEQTKLYQQLYQNLAEKGEHFYSTYRQFIAEVVQPLFNEPIYYQAFPTHRIHFIDAHGQLRFHRDNDYGHKPEEVNFFVPQTPVFGTNSIFIESGPQQQDFEAVEMAPGEFLQFKGTALKHGAHENQTGSSRVSFDFRVIPLSTAPQDVHNEAIAEDHTGKNLQAQLAKNAHTFALCHP